MVVYIQYQSKIRIPNLHGVRLSTSRLSICKYSSIVTRQNIYTKQSSCSYYMENTIKDQKNYQVTHDFINTLLLRNISVKYIHKLHK